MVQQIIFQNIIGTVENVFKYNFKNITFINYYGQYVEELFVRLSLSGHAVEFYLLMEWLMIIGIQVHLQLLFNAWYIIFWY